MYGAGDVLQFTAAALVASGIDMTSGSCLVVEALAAITAHKSSHFALRNVEESVGIEQAVAFESSLVGTHAPLKFTCAIGIALDRRTEEAGRAVLFMTANEFRQWSRLQTGFEKEHAFDAADVVVGGNKGMAPVPVAGPGSCAHCSERTIIMDGMGRSCDARFSTSNARYGRRK